MAARATRKEILRLLGEREIPAVLIGGLALRIYTSPRFTPDMDLAIRSLDADSVIELMYANDYRLVSAVGSTEATLLPEIGEALKWAERGETRSMTFVRREPRSLERKVPLRGIEVSSQVDFFFDLAIPVMRLKERARVLTVDGVPVLVAAPQDLLALKRARQDKSDADLADIAFLEDLLRAGRGSG